MKDKKEEKRTKSDREDTEERIGGVSPEEYEVLRALDAGLHLQKIGARWEFVGKWQNPETSGVKSAIVDGLLARGLISIHATISENGRAGCRDKAQKIMQLAHEWWKSRDLL